MEIGRSRLGTEVETTLQKKLDPVIGKLRRQIVLRFASTGLVAAGVVGIVLGLARVVASDWVPWYLIVAAVVLIPLAAAVFATTRKIDRRDAARAIDRHYDLQDRTLTALAFLREGESNELQQMQIDDAMARLGSLDSRKVVTAPLPSNLVPGFVLTAIALGTLFLPQVVSSVVANTMPTVKPDADDAAISLSSESPLPNVSKSQVAASQKLKKRPSFGVEASEPPIQFGYRTMVDRYFEQTQQEAGTSRQ